MARILLNASLADSLLRFRGDLIADIIMLGHEVHVTAPDFAVETHRALQALGAVVHSVPLRSSGLNVLADAYYFYNIYRTIKQTNVDLVIGYTIKPNIWGSLAARAAGVESVSMVTGLGYAFILREGLVRKATQKLAQLLYRFATSANKIVIFQNPDDRADFIAAGSLADPSKSRLVNGSGVDIDYFSAVPLPEKPIFLMISRFLWTKGVGEYCKAAIRLIERQIDAEFLLVGYSWTGPDAISSDQLRRWEDGGVKMLGKLSDVRPAMTAASVYVLPSWREGTPRSVLEALAMGRPVITTDAPGCRETVKQGLNGLLVPVQNVAALADAMELLAGDPAARIQMGGNSRSIAETKYAVRAVNLTYIDHFNLR